MLLLGTTTKNNLYARKILEKKEYFRNVKHDDIKLGQMQFGACVLSYQHYCVIFLLYVRRVRREWIFMFKLSYIFVYGYI